jgi:hypothetical protein
MPSIIAEVSLSQDLVFQHLLKDDFSDYGKIFSDDPYEADDEDHEEETLMADEKPSHSSGCVDSGASSHYVPHTRYFIDRLVSGTQKPSTAVISTAGPNPLYGVVQGSFVLKDPVFGVPLLLKKVTLVENLRRPLISIPMLSSEGYIIVFAGSRCVVLTPGLNEGCLLLDRRTVTGLTSLFEVPLSFFCHDVAHVAALAQAYAGPDTYITWHHRLGHLHSAKMAKVLPDFLTNKQCAAACPCHACIAAKIHHTAFPKTSQFVAPFPGHSTSLDFAGPFRVRSPFGERYFCLFIDVAVRFKDIRLAKLKSELDQFLLDHIARVERIQQPRRVCTIISDGALSSTAILSRLRTLGISVLIIAPGASRLNLVERGNRSIAEGARAMMDTAGLPPTLFLQACVAMVAVDNRVYKQTKLCSPSGRPLSPIELYENHIRGSIKELLAPLRVFGCLTFSLQKTDKQVTKAERCIMLGPAPFNPKAYLLMSLERKRYFISRDVVTEETSFPFKKAFQICPAVSTPHNRDETDDETEKYVPDVQPTSNVLLDQYDVPEVPIAPWVTYDPDDSAELDAPEAPELPADVDQSLLKGETDNLSPLALRDLFANIPEAPEPRLTRSATRLADEDATRTRLGTGDVAPAARSSPATFEIGKIFESAHFGQPVQIVKNNADGDVQVTFPDCADKQQYTVDKKLIDDIEFDDQALVLDHQPAINENVLLHPLDWIPTTLDGLLVPSCDFTLFDDSKYAIKPSSAHQRLTQQHGGFTYDPKYHVAFLTNEELIGKVLAEEVDIPKYHFGLTNHPLRGLCEQAMGVELDTLCRKGVFGEGRLPLDGEVVIGTMFVLKAKSDADGLLAKIKARLTVLGNQEKQDLLSYSPVMLLTSLRLLLSLHAADLDVHFHSLDITAAFVSARAVRDITVKLPTRFNPPGHKPGFVYPLLFNLYGTIDAPRAFYLDYFEWHRSIGFSSIHEDQCYLSIERGNDFIKFVTHVDDSGIAQKGDKLWQWYLKELGAKYDFRVEKLSFMLGMRFTRDPATGAITIDQDAQVDKMTRCFNLQGKTKKASTPVAAEQGRVRPSAADLPSSDEDKAKAQLIPYRQGVGHLGFLQQTTHFEISYALKVASQFLCNWSKRAWEWVKHIMCYLKSKRHRKFIIRGGTQAQQTLRAYSDADHITDVDTRRSISGYFILCGTDIIAWRSSFQTVVAHSSTESELMAIDLTVRRVQALRWLLAELGGNTDAPTDIEIDCASAITMSENPIQNHRNCHIHARFFYVRDLINDSVVALVKVDTKLQLADLLVTYKSVANFVTLMEIAKPQ